MFATATKQLVILMIAIGIIAPTRAMDIDHHASGWLGWKTFACVTVVVGAGALWAYHAWSKPVSKRPVSKKTVAKKVKEQNTKQQEEQATPVTLMVDSSRVKSAKELDFEKNLTEFNPEFVASEMLRLDAEIAQLELEIAQEGKK